MRARTRAPIDRAYVYTARGLPLLALRAVVDGPTRVLRSVTVRPYVGPRTGLCCDGRTETPRVVCLVEAAAGTDVPMRRSGQVAPGEWLWFWCTVVSGWEPDVKARVLERFGDSAVTRAKAAAGQVRIERAASAKLV